MKTKCKTGMFIVVMALCVMLLCPAMPVTAAKACTSVEQAVQIVREAMENREAKVTITYESATKDSSLADQIVQEALGHTGSGTQGDYIYFHLADWREEIRMSYYDVNGPFYYEFTYQFSYHTTADQETQLNREVNAVLTSLNLKGKTDYEKVKAIFDYICANVIYDYTNLNNEAYTLKYSAYAALINGTSVCQGYANLFYRLANAAGLDTRTVSGWSRGQGHAWNIVKVDGKYYNVDTTWDAVTKDYSYFLKGSANFDEHTPDGAHPENYASYNISATDYVPQTQVKPTEAPTEEPTEATTEVATKETTTEARPTEAPTEEPTEATTEVATKETTTEERPTETPTEEPTEATTEVATKETATEERPTEALTEEPTEATTEVATKETTTEERPTETPTEELTEATTEAATKETTTEERPTQAPSEQPNPTEPATEGAQPTESTPESSRPADDSTASATESNTESTAETTVGSEESEDSTEETGEGSMPEETIAAGGDVTDDPDDKSGGNTLYIILGVAGVVVVGTAIGAVVVIGKKRKVNE